VTGRLTTHVLDTARGCPAAGIPIQVSRRGIVLCETVTNADGRCDAPLLEGDAFQAGVYEVMFRVGRYFGTGAEPPFLDEIVVRFGVADGSAHYHVPLLVSAHGYSTYRGS
jgi:5-hydroxyisourate hydrolase